MRNMIELINSAVNNEYYILELFELNFIKMKFNYNNALFPNGDCFISKSQ